ncbi:MAG: hypothetical protein MJY67_00465 [Bacteroidales bacterium]|nr:hypothetical protein [Bacteroidales bacterium]
MKRFYIAALCLSLCLSSSCPPPDGKLTADGNDAGTYDLIKSSGYEYETPDNSGAHAQAPFRHITQCWDEQLGENVFEFHIHVANDDDRGKANIKDRQRNEIKTDAKSPSYMKAAEGETMRMSWKFKLPKGMKTTSRFTHIHQLKGIDNKEKTADVGHPMITFTCRSMSNGKQQFQVIYTGRAGSENETLAKLNLADFLGEWVSVTETVTCAREGKYSLKIERVSDKKVLLEINDIERDFYRDGTPAIRPKWGIYRWFGKDRSNADELRDEVLRFADFNIEKL